MPGGAEAGRVRVPDMAIPKVCGIETEYGILVRGPVADTTSNPVTASSILINAYLATHQRRIDGGFHLHAA